MTLVQRASQAKLLSVESGQQPTFTAFPKGTLLEAGNVPIAEIAELALREGQCTNPIYRVHQLVRTASWLTVPGHPDHVLCIDVLADSLIE